MHRNYKVIKISGIGQLLFVLFLVACFLTGFFVLPGFIIMHIWNIAFTSMLVPKMTILHGAMLWTIIVLIWFLFAGKNFNIGFATPSSMRKHYARLNKMRNAGDKNVTDEMEAIKKIIQEENDFDNDTNED